jgi:hypothetical protein
VLCNRFWEYDIFPCLDACFVSTRMRYASLSLLFRDMHILCPLHQAPAVSKTSSREMKQSEFIDNNNRISLDECWDENLCEEVTVESKKDAVGTHCSPP